MTARALYNFYI